MPVRNPKPQEKTTLLDLRPSLLKSVVLDGLLLIILVIHGPTSALPWELLGVALWTTFDLYVTRNHRGVVVTPKGVRIRTLRGGRFYPVENIQEVSVRGKVSSKVVMDFVSGESHYFSSVRPEKVEEIKAILDR